YAEKKGYYPVSKNVDLSDKSKPLNITENIVLVSIEEMKARELSVRINNIFFDFNKFELKQESFTELNRLGKILKESDLKVEIGGHTDSRGSDKANLELSKKRAQSVVDYLVSVGVKKENLIAKGYGETKPVSVTDTEEGYAQNRRVEFKFVK
nr:OmpA family protein [Ignavibacteriaceae bacterium]